MRIDILTLFPSMFTPLEESMIGKACKKGLLDICITDLRSYAKDKHRTADDTPYGGGAGMVMKPDMIFEAVKKIKSGAKSSKTRVILLTPAGRKLDQGIIKDMAKDAHLILICGHYEGVDQRVTDELVDDEISIGDYVLTGGELPAMVLIDSVARLIPGVLGNKTSAAEESFSYGLLEYPQYTKPQDLSGAKVPEILMSGDHKKIAKWRRQQSVMNTFYMRPELLAKADLSREDMGTLENLFTGGQ